MQKLIFGEAIEEMKKLPEGSVDMVLADIPYGTTACKWDTVIPFEPMWEQINRVIKTKGAIVMTGSQPFTSSLIMSNAKMFRYEIVWNKVKPSNFQMMNFQVGRVHENILVFSKSPAVFSRGRNMIYIPQKTTREKTKTVSKTFYGSRNSTLRDGHTIKDLGEKKYDLRHPTSIFTMSNANMSGKKFHKTQKPVALMEYLVKTYTNEGETVLDFTCGSGSTIVACQNTSRNGIGIDNGYCDVEKIVNGIQIKGLRWTEISQLRLDGKI